MCYSMIAFIIFNKILQAASANDQGNIVQVKFYDIAIKICRAGGSWVSCLSHVFGTC